MLLGCALVWRDLVLYFLHVVCALVLWHFVLCFPVCWMRSANVKFRVIYSLCGIHSGIMEFCVIFFAFQGNTLWYCGIFNIFLSDLERVLVLLTSRVIFSMCWTCSGIFGNFMVYIFWCRTGFGIVELGVICFYVLNVLWYVVNLCHILLRVECALLLWNFVFRLSTCGTHSSIVEFYVKSFSILNALWYCGILCHIVSVWCMRFSSVKFSVIFFCVSNALWYYWILCYIFLRVERALVLWNFIL